MTLVIAGAVQADLDADFTGRLVTQKQMGRLWETEADPPLPQVQSHADQFIEQQPGCLRVDWIDPSNRVHRLGSPETSGADPSQTPTLLEPLREAMQEAVAKKDGAVAIVRSDGAQPRLVSVLPLYRQATFRGFLLATCDLKDTFDSMLEDTKGLGYAIGISLSTEKDDIYRLPADLREGESEWGQVVDLHRPPVTFRLRIWPKPTMLANLDTRVPEAALFVGILLSILLVMSVHFAETARAQSRHVNLANRQLSSEVAERRMTEAALKASQARLAGILEISADAVVSVDEDQRITLFNQGAEKIFGYRSEEVLGQPLDKLLPSAVRQRHRQHVEEFAHRQVPTVSMSQRTHITGVRKDGTEFPADASISKLELPEGKVYTAILRDVTYQVKAERELRSAREQLEVRVRERTAELAAANAALQAEISVRSERDRALRESRERLQAIVDNSAAAIFMKDTSGTYILVNRFFESLCQLPREQILGKTSRDIFTREKAETLRAHDQQVLQTRAPIEFEEALEHDGELHTYLAIKFPLCDSEGTPYAVCGISTDITKRKQAENSLRELSAHLLRLQDEERRKIARDLHDSAGSHLFALSINLAKAQGLCREQDKELRKALEDGLQSVEDFSSEIRTLSYLLHPPLLDELGLVSALNSYVNGFAERSGIRAKFVAPPDLGRLPRSMELTVFRIVQEALTNIHHHSGSPTANVAINKSPAGVVVTISDEGRGIPPEKLAGSGGVGISGMRERVRQLGGTLEIQSGKGGTVMKATLPSSESATGAGTSALAEHGASGR